MTKKRFFFAVYDQQMIYNAEMYIEEGNPYDYTNDYNEYNQIPIEEWTRFSDNEPIYDSVAYSYGCRDDVEHFSIYMEEQKELLDTDNTLAPDGDWDNYFSLPSDNTKIPPFAYRPGYSSWAWIHLGYVPPSTEYLIATTKSAGIDCSGFVTRCASYDNTPYVLRTCKGYHLNDTTIDRFGKTDTEKPENYAVNYRCDGAFGFQYDVRSTEIDANAIVPGDILIYPKKHVVIVRSVAFNTSGNRVVNKNITFVIEATRGPDNQWKVMKINTWDDLGVVDYKSRRLKTN